MADRCEINNDDSLVKPVTTQEKNAIEKSTSQQENDAEKANTSVQAKVTLGTVAGSMGGDMPLVQINGYTMTDKELVRLEIDQSGFYPTLNLTLKFETGVFVTRYFPKDGDLINVFIRSFSDALKPIRNDYLITKITSSKSQDGEGNKITLFIKGILNIPLLYAESCTHIPMKTSFDALLDVATQLKLGFASNETSTDDAQNWICPYNTYNDFIDSIVTHSWKDDSSFFYAFIDVFYVFNFLNMNKLLIVKDNQEPTKGIMKGLGTSDMYGTEKLSTQKVDTVLTNSPDMQNTNYYYNGMQLLNKSGEINILNGYKRFVHFYEKILEPTYATSTEKHSSFFVDPMVTPGTPGKKVIMKGRVGEDTYLTQVKHKWQGLQYSLPDHNVHKNYKYAEYHNFQNTQEMSKLNVRIIIPNPNFNFFRGQRVPLMLVISQDPERVRVAGNEADKPRTTGATLDRFISGQYIILSTKLIYAQDSEPDAKSKKGKYSQELLLGRREWSMPNTLMRLDENDPEKWSSEKPL